MFLTNYLFFFINKTFNLIPNKENKQANFFFLANTLKIKYFLFKLVKNINVSTFFSYFQIFKSNFFFSNFFFIFILKKSFFFLNNTIFNQNIYFFFSNTNINYLNLNLFNQNNVMLFNIKNNLNLKLKSFLNFQIKFSISDFFKYINNRTINSINILFLRKNKIFNKGRYSRNRQYYRTGVYWCLYVNIIAVVGIYFWFYRFNMNFGYLWWILYFFLFSLFFSRSYSLNVFGIKQTFSQIFASYIWFFTIIYSFISKLNFFFFNILK